MAVADVFVRSCLVGVLTGLCLGLATGTFLVPVIGSFFGAVIGIVIGLALGVLEAAVLSAATFMRVPPLGLVLLGGATATAAAVIVAMRLDATPPIAWAIAAAVGALGAGLTAPTVKPPRRDRGGRPLHDSLIGTGIGAVVGLVRGLDDANYLLVFLVADVGCGALCGLLVTAIKAVVGVRDSRTRWSSERHA